MNQQTTKSEQKTTSSNPLLEETEALLLNARALALRYGATLPESVKTAHWMAAKAGPNAWEEVGLIHGDVPGLLGVATLTSIIAQLEGLLGHEQVRGQAANLSLGKMRGRP
jgi:hypothetical protein